MTDKKDLIYGYIEQPKLRRMFIDLKDKYLTNSSIFADIFIFIPTIDGRWKIISALCVDKQRYIDIDGLPSYGICDE